MTQSKPTTKLVPLRDVCATLGCCRRSFWMNWHAHFTETRPRDRRKGHERKVYADELDVAVEQSAHCPAALLNYRRRVGRL
jgi:hypothetical protein